MRRIERERRWLPRAVFRRVGGFLSRFTVVDAEAPWLRSLSIVGVKQIHRILEVVEETLKGNKIQLLAQHGLPALNLPKIRRDRYIEIIPISEGCLGRCTYCKTRFARGRLVSYPLDAIHDRLEQVGVSFMSDAQAVRDGVYEIWLSSEDTGAYGIDLKLTVVDLLQSVVKGFPADCVGGDGGGDE